MRTYVRMGMSTGAVRRGYASAHQGRGPAGCSAAVSSSLRLLGASPEHKAFRSLRSGSGVIVSWMVWKRDPSERAGKTLFTCSWRWAVGVALAIGLFRSHNLVRGVVSGESRQ